MVYVCDSCLTAAYDEGAKDRQMQEYVCTQLGAEIPDHNCDEWEKCECGCRSGL